MFNLKHLILHFMFISALTFLSAEPEVRPVILKDTGHYSKASKSMKNKEIIRIVRLFKADNVIPLKDNPYVKKGYNEHRDQTDAQSHDPLIRTFRHQYVHSHWHVNRHGYYHYDKYHGGHWGQHVFHQYFIKSLQHGFHHGIHQERSHSDHQKS